jgi:hypothetical protein
VGRGSLTSLPAVWTGWVGGRGAQSLLMANLLLDTKLMEQARVAAAEMVFETNGRLPPLLKAAVQDAFPDAIVDGG